METTETELKLSDYMLLGIAQTDRLEKLYVSDGTGRPRTCAIGAACYVRDRAVMNEYRSYYTLEQASAVFPELLEAAPEEALDLYGGMHPEILADVIMILNDKLHWRRDRVARYVRKLGY
jgi:hypothetical protein